ncbi:MAG: tRNA threonylcarbamoyladenosine dehydratase [Clostridiales bacterium]|nr:tRNA threonylcarbamoyladenosine dehydratase [Clostridiales bacterium]
MDERFSRTEVLLGNGAIEKLKNKCVAVFGVGGVGGYCVEALARSGIGKLVLIDSDTVHLSNLNRQIIALEKTVGKLKVEAFKERIMQINPNAQVEAIAEFFTPNNSHLFDFSKYDYVVDAVDTVTAKIELALKANESGVPIISSMGAGNKLDATKFEVADIYSTSVCPLARVMRRELKKRGVGALKVVYSKEEPVLSAAEYENGKAVPASCAFVPSVAGLIIAGEVVKDLIKK